MAQASKIRQANVKAVLNRQVIQVPHACYQSTGKRHQAVRQVPGYLINPHLHNLVDTLLSCANFGAIALPINGPQTPD